MEVDLYVPIGTDLTVIRSQYPDLCEDESPHESDEFLQCWIGSADEDCEDGEDPWLTYDEAVDFCGFCEGAIPDALTMVEGNGGWAQSMLRRRDFSDYTGAHALDRERWKRNSDRYWAAFEMGKQAAQIVPPK